MSQGRRIGVAGVTIGALVTAWALFMGVTGWAFDPVLGALFALVILFEIVVLVFDSGNELDIHAMEARPKMLDPLP